MNSRISGITKYSRIRKNTFAQKVELTTVDHLDVIFQEQLSIYSTWSVELTVGKYDYVDQKSSNYEQPNNSAYARHFIRLSETSL